MVESSRQCDCGQHMDTIPFERIPSLWRYQTDKNYGSRQANYTQNHFSLLYIIGFL